MEAEIRPFAIADYVAARDVWLNTPGLGLDEAADSEEGIRSFLERNPDLSFVAIERGALVGTVLCGHDGRRGFLYHLAVAQASRRRGIGKALTQAALDALSATGIRKCHLFVLNANTEGLAFWDLLGWSMREDIATFSKKIALSVNRIA